MDNETLILAAMEIREQAGSDEEARAALELLADEEGHVDREAGDADAGK